MAILMSSFVMDSNLNRRVIYNTFYLKEKIAFRSKGLRRGIVDPALVSVDTIA